MSTVTQFQQASIDTRWTEVEEFFQLKPLQSSTRRSYETWLRNFCEWTSKAWSEIGRDDIEQYRAYLAKQTTKDRWTARPKPRYSQNSQAAALITLKSFFGWLTEQQYISHNPTGPTHTH